MNFILAENLDEVFAVVFDKNAKGVKKTSGTKKDGKKPKAPAAAA